MPLRAPIFVGRRIGALFDLAELDLGLGPGLVAA